MIILDYNESLRLHGSDNDFRYLSWKWRIRHGKKLRLNKYMKNMWEIPRLYGQFLFNFFLKLFNNGRILMTKILMKNNFLRNENIYYKNINN